MTIPQLRAAIFLGNVLAGSGLLVAGGSALWRVVLPPRAPKPVEIRKDTADVKRPDQKPPVTTFKNTWDLPIVPDMQPRPDMPKAGPEVPSTGVSVEQAENMLKQAFELRGTFPNWSNPANSWASVVVKSAGPNTDEVLIAPDDKPAGHKVLAILDTHVRFSVQGTPANLRFENPELVWSTVTQRPDRGGAGDAALTGGEARASGEEPFVAQGKPVSAVLWQVTAAEVQYVGENYNRILREVGFRPHKGTDGKLDGVELTDVDQKSLVAKRGFETRDVIKSVNDEPVNDPRTLPDVLRRQAGKTTIKVVFVRRGVEQTVTYTVK